MIYKYFNPNVETLLSAIRSETVQHPEWVKTDDDFVVWIGSLRKES